MFDGFEKKEDMLLCAQGRPFLECGPFQQNESPDRKEIFETIHKTISQSRTWITTPQIIALEIICNRNNAPRVLKDKILHYFVHPTHPELQKPINNILSQYIAHKEKNTEYFGPFPIETEETEIMGYLEQAVNQEQQVIVQAYAKKHFSQKRAPFYALFFGPFPSSQLLHARLSDGEISDGEISDGENCIIS